jgi:sortase A
VRSYLRPLGEVLVTCGVVVVFFLAYMVWGTAVREGSAQHRFAGELSRQWASPGTSEALLGRPGHVALGQPFAFIRIPAFGAHWQFVIVQGTGLAQLALGPGHVVGTQWPGQVGNFAVAGHRVTAGNPFWSVPSLRAGNKVFIDTVGGTFEYEVTTRPVWVWPGDTAVLAPAPGFPGQQPRRAWITLITCDPAWSGTSRVIVTGVLIKRIPRAATNGS